jgi:arabinofuranosyltransferase
VSVASTVPVTSNEEPAEPRGRRTWLFVAVGLGLLFLLGTRAAWFFTIDDAYITFRYSDNFAAGDGPVWNVGEDPVEGFTNFLWMLWHTPVALFGLDLPLVAKLTSFAAGAVALVLLVRYCHQRYGLVSALVAGGAYVVFVPTYFHVTSGLETIAFAALLLRVVIVGLRAINGQTVRAWEPPLLLVLAGMLRPEGVLAALPAFAAWLWANRRDRTTWLWTGGAAVVGGAYFAWRWVYYGHPFPNTFYVKFGNIDAGELWLQTTVPLLLPLLLCTLALLIRRDTRWSGVILIATVGATYLTYLVSGPTMDYLYRFAYHAFPVLCLAAGLAVGPFRRWWLASGIGAVAVGWVAVTGVQAPDLPLIANYGPDLARTHVPIGQGLAEADVPPEFRTLAVNDAGAIPYYSRWNTIDFIGLNDEPVAHGENPTTRVVDAEPTVIVVRSYDPNIPADAYGLDVAAATRGYEHVATVQMRVGYYCQIFVLPEWAEEVRAPVMAAVDAAQATYDPGRYEDTIDRWLDRLRAGLSW